MAQAYQTLSDWEVIHPADDFDAQIQREWLLTNGLGGYASGTVLGIPARRYHGLLVAAARPPLERWLLLSAVLERIGSDGRVYELPGFEFGGKIHPVGYQYLTGFAVQNDPRHPAVWFEYQIDDLRLLKQVVLPYGQDEVSIRYRLTGPAGQPLSLDLAPFLAMRDFHALTHAFAPGYAVEQTADWVAVDAFADGPRIWMQARWSSEGSPVAFEGRPDWWYRLTYREEAARGQDHQEDLYTPGWFQAQGSGSIEVELRAVADFSGRAHPLPASTAPAAAAEPEIGPCIAEQQLRTAASAFVVRRRRPDNADLTTILAGYPWFGDWGRDTFIALPGLLLETERFAEAIQVLEVFASAQQDGLIPNRFSDYGDGRDYNSVDASLWFMHAADAYVQASGDEYAWKEILAPACARVVDAFVAGTRFNIRVEDDGLLTCGDATTQLTWMDAKCGDIVFTPRHGKPVEVNALWYHDLMTLAERARRNGSSQAIDYLKLAENCRQSFVETFWNDDYQCLYDVVRSDWKDMAIRPNQIFAVSLAHSPLSQARQQAVLRCVERELLTPYGLRSLSPHHPSYRGRYEGGPFDRDSVYHQGTVWGWLIGPFVEAYLRVHKFSNHAKKQMRKQLRPLLEHLQTAGIGSISEIFDGDSPHTPRGCIAQAWSVSELLRAWHLTELE